MMGRNVMLLKMPTKTFVARNAKFSTSIPNNKDYQLLVVGGGTGGCATAARFSAKLGKGNVAVIEPTETHYYQPLWTLVGAGMRKLEESGRPMGQVLPKNADWIKQKVVTFKPNENKVVTEDGSEIGYEYLVVAMGLQLNYDKIKGLPDAFETPGVCSNYSPLYVNKTSKAIEEFKKGHARFTFPNTPIKCAGAPQKIMYIFEERMRKSGIGNYGIKFYSGLPVLFSSKYYADVLWKVAQGRNIEINLKRNLIAIDPDKNELQFENVENPKDVITEHYDFVHITPPMSTPDVLRTSGDDLVDAGGYLNLNKETLQHVKYPNIFGIGDCTSLPTSKTAAAVAGQLGTLTKNLTSVINNFIPAAQYNGYTSCPLVTGKSTCILAEFDYQTNPIETFPVDQRKERYSMSILKKNFMPFMYWNGMLKGYWEGPEKYRKWLHLGFKQ